MSHSSTIKAARVHQYGGPEQLIIEEIPRPVPRSGEVLVQIRAAAVNPVDWKKRQGYLSSMPGQTLPLTLGQDFSGVIVEVGPDVSGFAVGDAVLAMGQITGGAFAEYFAVEAAILVPKPPELDWSTAAAIPMGGLTAWQAIFNAGKLQAGERILVHAASGGVGSMAVQFARWKGAHVIATASEHNRDFVLSLGADEFIDYRTEKFEYVAKNIDLVFDTVGGDTQERSFGVLKPGGRLVTIVQEPSQELAARHAVNAQVMWANSNAADLQQIVQLVVAGTVKVHLDKEFTLEQTGAALAASQTHHACGKLVIAVSAD